MIKLIIMSKKQILCFLLMMGLSVFCLDLAHAQSSGKNNCKKKNDIACLGGEEVIFITGMVKDVHSKGLLLGEELHFANSGESVLYANITKSGHYAIAIQKETLKEVANLAIQIEGYDTVILTDIHLSKNDYVNRDLYLQKLATIKATPKVETVRAGLNESPNNPFILQF